MSQETALGTSVPDAFSWKLNKKEWTSTIFKKQKMREYADVAKVLGFISHEMGITFADNKRYDGLPSEIRTELDMVKAFYGKYSKSTPPHFDVSHRLPKHGWGRTIPSSYLSLSVFHRPTRHALCDGIHRDLDMVNAHATIIFRIGTQNGMELPFLKHIVDDPKRWRKTICDHHGLDYDISEQRDIGKQLVTSLLFGGSYASWIRENNIEVNVNNPVGLVKRVEQELRGIREIVFQQNQQIMVDVLRHDPQHWKDDVDAKRGVMALWAQTIERRIMESCIMYLVINKGSKLEDLVPCQDGFKLRNELWYEGIQADLERVSLHSLNLGVLWVEKPFDEAIAIPLHADAHRQWKLDLKAKPLEGELLSLRMGDFHLSDFIRCTVGGKFYVFHSGRWHDESDDKKRKYIIRYISEDLFNHHAIYKAVELKEEERDKYILAARDATSDIRLISHIITHVKTEAKTDGSFNNQPYLLGWENGVLDLRIEEFRPYCFSDFITVTTGRDYVQPDYNDPANVDKRRVLLKIFSEIQGADEMRSLLLQILASGLDGINYQAACFFNGKGGNGKGLISRFMRFILGHLCKSPRAEILKECMKNNNGASPDIAELQHARYIIFPEVGGKLNMAMIKRMTGGDELTGRQLYGDNISFVIPGTFVFEFNDPPEFDTKLDNADARRIRDVEFFNNWTEDPEKIGKTIDGRFYREANPFYATLEFVQSHADVFLDILLDIYKDSFVATGDNPGLQIHIPDSVWRASKAFIENTSVFKICFEEMYTPRKKPCTENSDILEKCPRVSAIWETICSCDTYKAGQRANSREYQRNWGQKKFHKWIEGFAAVQPVNNVKYVTNFVLEEDLEAEPSPNDLSDSPSNDHSDPEYEEESD